ncbi:MAG: hypothetical protein EOP08_14510 [Proteobacteria bacterium]|nr:MAG: hypothetical protein EOP08_14510 [Pseudomonadota bacterium]
MAARLDWQRLCAVLEDLARRDWLHVDAMVAAYRAVVATVHPALLEERLERSSDPRLRRLALEALKRAVRPKEGWSTELRAKLTAYRSDPSPLVAGAAAYVFLPEG